MLRSLTVIDDREQIVGRTRRRVTILVLTLEFLGLLLLVTSLYLAGGQKLACQPHAGAQDCTFQERRILGLLPIGRKEVRGVTGARVEVDGGLAYLVLATDTGETWIKAASEHRLEGDAARLRVALEQGEPLKLVWSDLLLAVAVGAFGLLWLTLMVLIMREFLGYHTPWWWRVLRRA